MQNQGRSPTACRPPTCALSWASRRRPAGNEGRGQWAMGKGSAVEPSSHAPREGLPWASRHPPCVAPPSGCEEDRQDGEGVHFLVSVLRFFMFSEGAGGAGGGGVAGAFRVCREGRVWERPCWVPGTKGQS